jgi:hypothetical protein
VSATLAGFAGIPTASSTGYQIREAIPPAEPTIPARTPAASNSDISPAEQPSVSYVLDLPQRGTCRAGPPPLPPASGDVIEVERTVNASGNVSLGNHMVSAGLPLAGHWVTLQLDGPVAHIMSGGETIQVGLAHARKTAEVTVEADTYQITVEPGITLTAPRTTSSNIRRHEASNYSPEVPPGVT